MLAYFGVSIIHQTQTWTTRFLACISVWYFCVGICMWDFGSCFYLGVSIIHQTMHYKVFNLHKCVIFLPRYIYTHGTSVHFLIQMVHFLIQRTSCRFAIFHFIVSWQEQVLCWAVRYFKLFCTCLMWLWFRVWETRSEYRTDGNSAHGLFVFLKRLFSERSLQQRWGHQTCHCTALTEPSSQMRISSNS